MEYLLATDVRIVESHWSAIQERLRFLQNSAKTMTILDNNGEKITSLAP